MIMTTKPSPNRIQHSLISTSDTKDDPAEECALLSLMLLVYLNCICGFAYYDVVGAELSARSSWKLDGGLLQSLLNQLKLLLLVHTAKTSCTGSSWCTTHILDVLKLPTP
jgi:hypothetical protein